MGGGRARPVGVFNSPAETGFAEKPPPSGN
jgi:hypothetical protein